MIQSFSDELKDQLKPILDLSERVLGAGGSNDLSVYCEAIGLLFDDQRSIGRDDTDTGLPGYAVLFNADDCPDTWLAWLAQWRGADLDPALDIDSQRLRVKTTDGMQRGKPSAIVGAAMTYLTGSRTVVLRERWDPVNNVANAWHYQVITYTDQTPDPAKVQAALAAQKPGGDILHYATETGQDWESLRTNYATWQAVKDAFANWDTVRLDEPI